MKSWPELAAERRRACADASLTPPAPPTEKVPELRAECGSSSLVAEACQSALETTRQMSNVPSVPSSSPRQGEVDEVTPFGMFGTFGFRHEAESAADQLIPGALPDPMDLAERAAILQANGMPREAAETEALQEAGFLSLEAYAATLAAQLKGNIEAALAPTTGSLARHWQALRGHSFGFLASAWWPLACRLGWSLIELFGIRLEAPLVRVEAWGLAIAPALSRLARTHLIQLTGEGAAFATLSGSRLSWPRFCGQRPEQATLWWELADRQCATTLLADPVRRADACEERAELAVRGTILVGEERRKLGKE